MFHWILDFEQATELLGSATNEHVALERTGHNANVFWPANAVLHVK